MILRNSAVIASERRTFCQNALYIHTDAAAVLEKIIILGNVRTRDLLREQGLLNNSSFSLAGMQVYIYTYFLLALVCRVGGPYYYFVLYGYRDREKEAGFHSDVCIYVLLGRY